MSTNENKIIIYFAGGTMRGVFGAGVAAAFREANLYPKISAVYGASAGIMTGAYFLAERTTTGNSIGASIYWENLNDKFMPKKNFFNFFMGTWQRFQNKFIKEIPQSKLRDAFDMKYLMHIIKDKKRLDIEKIISGNIPLNIKLFNLDSHEIEYIDARRPDILEILKAGVSVFPYVHEISVIDGKKYIDGAIMDIVGIEFLKKKHPDKKIIIVINGQIDRKIRYKLKNMGEGLFMKWMFNDSRMYRLYADAENRLAEDLKIIESDPSLLLIAPEKDMGVRSRTTDKNLLLEFFNLGIKTGRHVLKSPFMNQ